jgi:hypothetical protein
MILLLEDDLDRIRRFSTAIERFAPGMSVRIWNDAHRMAREVDRYLESARLISLDHDLESQTGDPDDLGDGVIVAKALIAVRQPCPVIIHSSNRSRSDWMAGEFELAGWEYRRVAPIGRRWIEEYWRIVASELIESADSDRE